MRISDADIRQALRPLEQIREAVGMDIEVMIDGHTHFQLPAALRIAEALRPLQPLWLAVEAGEGLLFPSKQTEDTMKYAITTLLFLVSTSCFAQGNLVANGSFEGDALGHGVARGWIAEPHGSNTGTLALDGQVATAGRQSLRIEHPEDNSDWVRANQDGIPARPKALYRFDGWVRSTGPAEVQHLDDRGG